MKKNTIYLSILTIRSFCFILIVTLSFLFVFSAHAQWVVKSSGLDNQLGLQSMVAPLGDSLNCYAIAYNDVSYWTANLSIISKTNNGGTTWQKVDLNTITGNRLWGSCATPRNVVHVIGNSAAGGNLFKSKDGGNTWVQEGSNTFTDVSGGSFVNNIFFFNAKDGVVFGDPEGGYFEIYTTSDSGNTWSRVPSANIPARLPNEYGLTFYGDQYQNTVWMGVTTWDASFANITNSRLFRSDDKGLTWYVKNSNMPLSQNDVTMRFRDANVGLMKTYGSLYRTIDGGGTWTQFNYCSTWYASNLDYIPGTSSSWISSGGALGTQPGTSISPDDGTTWVPIDAGTKHTCVKMTSDHHGYSGGVSTGSGTDGVFTFNGITGINENNNSNQQWSIYPNPVSDKIYIKSEKQYKSNKINLSIYDIDGRVLIQKTKISFNDEIDVSMLTKGMYLVEIENSNGKSSDKFIKE